MRAGILKYSLFYQFKRRRRLYCIVKLHLLNGPHKQSIEMQEQSDFYLEQHG